MLLLLLLAALAPLLTALGLALLFRVTAYFRARALGPSPNPRPHSNPQQTRHSVRTAPRQRFARGRGTPLALAALVWACLAHMAHAANVSASASYALDTGAVTTLTDAAMGAPVDVSHFSDPNVASTASGLGVHAHGDPLGNIGSRSSGAGVYNVASLLHYTNVVTNNATTAQTALFTFTIAPGLVQSDVRSNLAAGEYLQAGVAFQISTNGVSVWSSAADMLTTGSTTGPTTVFQAQGENLYTPAIPALAGASPTTYTFAGGVFTANLGLINPGDTLSFTYDLSSYARGVSAANGLYTTPVQGITMPQQTMQVPTTCTLPGGCTTLKTVAGGVTSLGGQTYQDQVSGSYAGSGDPFVLDWNGSAQDPVGNGPGGHAVFGPLGAPSVALVPEPGSVTLMLAAMAALARRKFRLRSKNPS